MPEEHQSPEAPNPDATTTPERELKLLMPLQVQPEESPAEFAERAAAAVAKTLGLPREG